MAGGTPTPGGAWNDRDRACAIALRLYEDDLDPDCGHPRRYAWDADAAGHYKVPAPTRCHACTAIGKESAKYADQVDAHALRFGAVPDEALEYAMAHPDDVQHPTLTPPTA